MPGPITRVEGGTITTARGFRAGGTYVGIKTYSEDKMDMGLLLSDTPCSVAGVFTKSSLVSPSVTVNRETLAAGRPVRGLVVNSGIANAGVGEQGYIDAKEMAAVAAVGLGVKPDEVLVFSTGVIGVELPMTLIKKGVDEIELAEEGGNSLARAMMTTDTRTKEAGVSVNLGGVEINICGVAKGSGMIHPNMATMLCFVTTDGAVEQDYLRSILPDIADDTLNMLDIDGDTSTNDSLVVLANGAAGNTPISPGNADADLFKEALAEVLVQLTRQLAQDGEGATRLIVAEVRGARNLADARMAAKTITSSLLVKSAVYGADPNWGRLIMALGRSGAETVESKIDLYINDVCIMEAGRPVPFHRDAVVALMRGDEVTFGVNLNLADGQATAWGCDLTEEYVVINSAYTT
ncbi:MAG: bifunctional glutamate N-acetyltransferase/amino-acid acetyltransferase ArgJ [Chloroflexi bacterium]|nr:bifunctional glutamate N-acetyltransferase/amino-acid acetyltransferase ArgJ [Chloroflexota bacterium]MCI0802328.1 bifunctional glutamate N-acetyltransferase/amino-acid acetyltransferase ArgJ [Chloroflexota bacterium]MCI0829677.1 bifunctional glutamate N-acetyltransferase/amino-acid acetyltransferase ArgJ [Chloroflexota bacterium]MCI0848890.1 bifunctional glutamate N-acetyltransferase/amino-acid acetyltransferase ArgJ [Chloroflexota bacterium]MCI0863851.1 bifunctional glutamate N-acetyltrans